MPPIPELMNRVSMAQIPDTLQHRMEYNTDRSLKYQEFAQRGSATDIENGWLIYAFTYSTLNQATLRQTAYGTWDDRGTLTYA